MKEPTDSLLHPIRVDAGIGELARETDYAEHVEQMMRQVLFTSPGDRVNRPEFGCGVRRLVFAPNSEVSANLLKVTIFQGLDRWLGTVVRVEDVRVEALGERMEIRIAYVLRARQERRYLNVEVTL